jgi:rhodanese-related sulfurtransferase
MVNSNLYRKTPVMGWASWNCFRTNITEKSLKEQIDALKATGLDKYGYTYFNIDDGFFGGRDRNGVLQFHKERFPNGIKVIADYAHKNGLKAGIYSDGGDKTCGYYYDNEGDNGSDVGLYNHEEQDLKMYLDEYGFDFIKVDWCGGLRLGLNEKEQYTKISKIIDDIRKRTGRCIVFNICRWHFPGEWAAEVADSWRTGADITPDFNSVINQIDNIKSLRKFCSPSHINDLDMMQLGNGLSNEEEKTHFAMWCMVSTPLVIGCDLTKVSDSTLNILKNEELIAINQDKACKQAYVIKEIRDTRGVLLGEIWVKELYTDGEKAVAFLNRSASKLDMELSLTDAGMNGKILSVRNLCEHFDIKITEKISVTVNPHGTEVFRVKSESTVSVPDVNAALEYKKPTNIEKISIAKANELVADGAILLDVRSADEYKISHLDNAVNAPYTDIHVTVSSLVPNKEQKIIVYCATGKRSSQAKYTLDYMGYNNVYYLGGIGL